MLSFYFQPLSSLGEYAKAFQSTVLFNQSFNVSTFNLSNPQLQTFNVSIFNLQFFNTKGASRLPLGARMRRHCDSVGAMAAVLTGVDT